MAGTWMVRAGRGGSKVGEFLEHRIVALGDPELGPIPATASKADIARLYAQHYPETKPGSRAVWASQLVRLLRELKIGDRVVTSDRERRLYYLGALASDYEWAPNLIEDLPHVRRVTWTHQVPRDSLSTPTLNTLGAIQTLFKLGEEVARDLVAHQAPIGAESPTISTVRADTSEEEVDEASVRDEMLEKADEFVEDAINRLEWDEMQELVAGILRAMGYRTTVSAPGPDHGVDIFASPDGLGFREPRIFVEVKHRPGTQMNSEKIRSFLGGRKPGDRCLYVSTGSFTKDARYEAERAIVPTTLVNLQDLRRLLIDNYEKLDAETRALVPLRRIYWPFV